MTASTIAGDRLKSFIERVERLTDEVRALREDIKEVLSEAKGTGFDPKIIKLIIRIRAMGKDAHEEEQALVDTYMNAIGDLI